MTLYLQIYVGIGLAISLGLYLFQYERPSQFAKDIDKAIHGERPERPWHYRLREKLVIPGAILLITVCWPIAIYMAIKDLIDKKMNRDKEEIEYLDALVRGVYARADLPKGYIFSQENFARDFKLAVPLLKGQLSTREVLNGLALTSDLKAGQPLTIEQVSGPYNENESLRKQIQNRGL